VSQTRKVSIEAVRDREMIVRIGCSSLMPMGAFIAEMERRGYATIYRGPTNPDALFAGETIHVVGPTVPAKTMRRIVGAAKVEALKSSGA
jgi:hypothetical protein